MDANIYIIKNTVNEKVYIGQTTESLKKRFERHISDSKREDKRHRPLYLAFEKYGVNQFYIQLIETCDSANADEREIYWIKYYNSNLDGGYNATIGGKMYEPYDYNEIADLLQEGYTTKDIMKEVGCCKQLVYRVAKIRGLDIKGSSHNRCVAQYSLSGELLNVFDSIGSASRYLKETENLSTPQSTIRCNISRNCIHTGRKKCYGYKWEYADKDAV